MSRLLPAYLTVMQQFDQLIAPARKNSWQESHSCIQVDFAIFLECITLFPFLLSECGGDTFMIVNVSIIQILAFIFFST